MTAKRNKLPLDVILAGDCMEVMEGLPSASVDLIFADPPYNLQLSEGLLRPEGGEVAGVSDDWDRFESFAAYDRFSAGWLGAARRLLKPDGALWVIGAYHNIFRLGALLQTAGFWILNDIIWRKSNPMPNFRGRRFTNAHETLIWAARGRESRYVFNYRALKASNDDRQMRSDDWLFPLCTGSERLKKADGGKLHSAQKPEALLRRLILASTRAGDVVLDPFAGTGSSAAAAKYLGRRYIGIEREAFYVQAARRRLAGVEALEVEALETIPEARELPRISFGSLVEQRLVAPGSFLYDRGRRHAARVRADGSLSCRGRTGSIHGLGAQLLEASACNGWKFWHIKEQRRLIPIDALRRQARAELALNILR